MTKIINQNKIAKPESTKNLVLWDASTGEPLLFPSDAVLVEAGAQLFNVATMVVLNQIISSTGGTSANTAWDYAKVLIKGLSNIYISGSGSAQAAHYFRFTDDDGDLIAGEYGTVDTDAGGTLTVPSGAAYVEIGRAHV